ncbi:MAG: phenylphosphate carboxylase subunit beta [Desulfobacterota bacterium]|nr:phenylphosphate carboxylase subunit beta [Thermodesulfobacteriota bacterium]MDW8001874.1 phenylphosphate carboxylase subunit beta [Deltaproteobacteria bacterium]
MDLRYFIQKWEKEGQLRRIKAPVDWNLELSHVAKLVEERNGPSLLFENVKGYSSPVITGLYATVRRLSDIMGKPGTASLVELTREWMKTLTQPKAQLESKEVSTGPIFENVKDGDKASVLDFPVPKYYEKDGHRYFGTAVYMVSQDPETGRINLGTFRMGVHDERHLGVQILKGKTTDRILQRYAKARKKMPVCVVMGGDPLLMIASAATLPGVKSAYDAVSTLRGEPLNLVKGELTGLPFPADAEIAIEGEIDPSVMKEEGPFGEYTGYYTEELFKPLPKPVIEIKRIYFRTNPILVATTVGRPVGDQHMLYAFARNAALWTELESMKIPGIQSVYTLPEAAGRFWVIVSVRQMYPGHAEQVAHAVIASNTGMYGVKGVIVVDDDIEADDLPRVWWALGVRYNPLRGTQIIQRGRSTPLDPSLGPEDNKFITPRILINATIPYEWTQKPVEVRLNEEVLKNVKSRWDELGLSDI